MSTRLDKSRKSEADSTAFMKKSKLLDTSKMKMFGGGAIKDETKEKQYDANSKRKNET